MFLTDRYSISTVGELGALQSDFARVLIAIEEVSPNGRARSRFRCDLKNVESPAGERATGWPA